MEVKLVVVSLVILFIQYVSGQRLAARARIRPSNDITSGLMVSGNVFLHQRAGRNIRIRVILNGLRPNSLHGFHIHSFGSIFGRAGCGGAGGHYNPTGDTHGSRFDRIRHIGDLGNLRTDNNGKVDVTFYDRRVDLSGRNTVFGRAFVVHSLRDDLGRGTGQAAEESLITGNAGSRLACGIIIAADPDTIDGNF